MLNYYSKAEATPDLVSSDLRTSPSTCSTPLLLAPPPPLQGSQSQASAANQEIVCRLKCSAGLAELENRKYKNAARLFLQAHFDDCKFPDVSVH